MTTKTMFIRIIPFFTNNFECNVLKRNDEECDEFIIHLLHKVVQHEISEWRTLDYLHKQSTNKKQINNLNQVERIYLPDYMTVFWFYRSNQDRKSKKNRFSSNNCLKKKKRSYIKFVTLNRFWWWIIGIIMFFIVLIPIITLKKELRLLKYV